MGVFKTIGVFFTRTIRREAKTGKFVTKQYVLDHPDTTVTEVRKVRKSLKSVVKDFFSKK